MDKISLKNEMFTVFMGDADEILNRTIMNMVGRGVNDATVTLKLNIHIEGKDIRTEKGIETIAAPTITHDVSSTMQLKEKISGECEEDYAVIPSENGWALVHIDDGQITFYEENDEDSY